MLSNQGRGLFCAAVLVGVLGLPVVTHLPVAVAQSAPPSTIEISSRYTIYFNGFDIGEAHIEQRTAGRKYSASSNVEISALLGAFRWQGVTRTTGTLKNNAVEPSGYDFRYEGTSKSGSVRMGFTGGTVTALTAIPETLDPADFVPLQPAHVKSVIDPLSAIVAISRPASEPCGRKLPVFDGKQRFDLALTALRREPLSAGRDGGTVDAVVCRIRYTPVAGYRANADTRALAEATGIEVTFRPVAEAGLWVPYKVVIPTVAGPVSMEANRMDIRAPGLAQIALVD